MHRAVLQCNAVQASLSSAVHYVQFSPVPTAMCSADALQYSRLQESVMQCNANCSVPAASCLVQHIAVHCASVFVQRSALR